ncbi:MAG TPA: lipoprotein-releasing ABC transporter permease subunit [Coxiellaceae bacterium]|nr:lipoprotein-releasing ABC transporter permease subunit [Coxiellaceae bacterium]
MLKPLALYIGLKYTRAKRRNHFISFISLASMMGIALGVAVLITVLSVMNGFDQQIRLKFFAMAPHVTIMTDQSLTESWRALGESAKRVPGVMDYSPYIQGKGMLTHEGQVAGVSVTGIIPSQETRVSELGEKMTAGSLGTLQPGQFNMLIGQDMANGMDLRVGDKITLLTPQMSSTPLGIMPRYKRFTVTGIFHVGNGFGYDDSVVFINFQDADRLFQGANPISGLHLKIANLYQARPITLSLQRMLSEHYVVTNWALQYGAFFKALSMEKTMMFVILLLIIAVAAFNLVSSLVMVVNDKQRDIAILRTLGVTRGFIVWVFIIQGAVVGVIGTLLGIGGGIILALNATAWVNAIQRFFHVQLISSSVYFLDYLPSHLEVSDVIQISLIALGLSLLATLYPAWQASRTQPAEVLRYE